MKKKWLIQQTRAKSCLLFFNGWGMDEKAISHLGAYELDVCMFYEYAHLNGEGNDFRHYRNIYVVAWSLGVWVASKMIPAMRLRPEMSIAINGTLDPVNDQFGIPEAVFCQTLSFWDEKLREKFNRRMFGGMKALQSGRVYLPTRTPENQRDELAFLKDKIDRNKTAEMFFDKAIIGARDLIFPSENQMHFWRNKVSVIQKDYPHFPFANLSSWNEIIAF
jgi:biotin synthesis protein BioG